MGRNTTSAPAFLASVTCTEKSVVSLVKVVTETMFSPSSAALLSKV